MFAVDGKALRGRWVGDGPARMLMACLYHAEGVTISHVEIGEKINEIHMFDLITWPTLSRTSRRAAGVLAHMTANSQYAGPKRRGCVPTVVNAA